MIWIIGIIGYVLAVATIIAFFYGANIKDKELE
jgi:Mg2+ and Co2+ transporter CorA